VVVVVVECVADKTLKVEDVQTFDVYQDGMYSTGCSLKVYSTGCPLKVYCTGCPLKVYCTGCSLKVYSTGCLLKGVFYRVSS